MLKKQQKQRIYKWGNIQFARTFLEYNLYNMLRNRKQLEKIVTVCYTALSSHFLQGKLDTLVYLNSYTSLSG